MFQQKNANNVLLELLRNVKQRFAKFVQLESMLIILLESVLNVNMAPVIRQCKIHALNVTSIESGQV
jgi:hypothetical protein